MENIPPPYAPPNASLDTKQAAALLGVSVRTLYAYVSRGKLGRVVDPATRESAFNKAEVLQFVRRRDRGKLPENVARASLDYGLPVLESRISTVRDGRLWYREHDAAAFSATATLDDTARLLWQVPALSDAAQPEGLEAFCGNGPFIQRYMGWLAPQAGRADALPQVEEAGRLLRAGLALACRSPLAHGGAHELLGAAWRLGADARHLLRRALVLHADHELNTSTFAVRCVASADASLPASLLAGCCAASGQRHGQFHDAFALVSDAAATAQPRGVLRHWLDTRGSLPGFAHPLYPQGDPRAQLLLQDLRAIAPQPLMRRIDAMLELARGELLIHPKNDLAMAALALVLGLTPDACQTVFLVARSVGWCAHAMEQRASASLIRPRARYVMP